MSRIPLVEPEIEQVKIEEPLETLHADWPGEEKPPRPFPRSSPRPSARASPIPAPRNSKKKANAFQFETVAYEF